MRSRHMLILALLLPLLAMCSGGSGGSNDDDDDTDDGPDTRVFGRDTLTKEELMDPETCAECHPVHYREWSGSMHAYAAKDPVFIAMNERGQRETDGELDDFCVNCHAPLAVLTGATTDGLNLEELPDYLKGVTCYFCHSVDAVEGDHNNPLRLAEDRVMRAALDDPGPNDTHLMQYSALHDRDDLQSSELCGACHDIVTDAGVHLERTFAEWQTSLFADPALGEPLTCSGCHMVGYYGEAAVAPGMRERRLHRHDFPAVDLALTDFPQKPEQREAVQDFLDTALLSELCVRGMDSLEAPGISVRLENVAAGHAFPSGAAQDRRLWVELTAYRDGEEIYVSGRIPEGQAVSASDDPDLWQLRDYVYQEDGTEAHMFWDVAEVVSELLPAPTARFPTDPGYIDPHLTRGYPLPSPMPDRVTLRVHVRPMGLDVLDDLIASGDLDPAHRAQIPTFTLAATELEWRSEMGKECVTAADQ